MTSPDFSSQIQELKKRLGLLSSLNPEAQKRVLDYYRLLLEGNEVQNLTRLIAPLDFIEGHLLDVLELEKAGWIQSEAMDLGSGCGVPGLLAACVNPQSKWLLAESELRKREFLEAATQSLGLPTRVRVGARGEEVLRKIPLKFVVTRAVGKISKLWNYLGPCSTWNTLILFKGPAWSEEWNEFQKSSEGAKHLRVAEVHEYIVGEQQKRRALVRLERVPRGTSAE